MSVYVVGNFRLGKTSAPSLCQGSVCLSGDAAHATSPHHGAGAGFCIEDSAVLAALLSNKRVRARGDIDQAFAAFDATGRERVAWLVQSSYHIGNTYEWLAPGLEDDFEAIEKDINHRNGIIANVDVQGMCNEVVVLITKQTSMNDCKPAASKSKAFKGLDEREQVKPLERERLPEFMSTAKLIFPPPSSALTLMPYPAFPLAAPRGAAISRCSWPAISSAPHPRSAWCPRATGTEPRRSPPPESSCDRWIATYIEPRPAHVAGRRVRRSTRGVHPDYPHTHCVVVRVLRVRKDRNKSWT